MAVEEDSVTDELDCAFTLELETTTDELDLLTDELEDLAIEEDSVTDELDSAFALELETTIDELEELTTGDEFTCSPLEYIPVEDELFPCGSVLLFPLSPSHAAKISAAAAMHNNATRCFCFICCLLLALNLRLS